MPRRPRKIPFESALEVSERARDEITFWLNRLHQTVAVKNVEADPTYQKIDVDLIWTTQKKSYQVEIKGDLWHKTGNFFLETHSNKERNTPGCFLYTKADLVFYYFIDPRILYILPMPETQEWFKLNLNRFEEKSTTTPINLGSYTTVGRIVPINCLLEEVGGVKRVCL